MYLTLKDSADRTRVRGLVQAPDYAADGQGMLLLSLIGPQTAIFAVHANVVKHRPERTLVATQITLTKGAEQFPVRVTPGRKYHMSTMPPVAGQPAILILRTDFSKLGGHQYILGGTEEVPSPWFEAAMGNLPTLPYKREWLPILWREAQKANINLISPPMIHHIGIGVWQINTSTTKWELLLKRLIVEGTLS